jgi:hypothetical protein
MTAHSARAESLWTVNRRDVYWSCDLAFHQDRSGWQVVLRRDGTVVAERVFNLREIALAWASSERDDLERGWLDADGRR